MVVGFVGGVGAVWGARATAARQGSGDGQAGAGARGVSRRASRARVRSVNSGTIRMQYNFNVYQDGNERSKRTLAANDRAVSVQKPMGLLLEEAQDGMVFVAEVFEGSNAEMAGVEVGDIVVAVSATFGDEVWSTRGIGLARVMKSIEVRQGDFVTLVLESPEQVSEKKKLAVKAAAMRREDAREKFGEREVLDPNTWTKMSSGGSDSDAELKAMLDSEQAQDEGNSSQVIYGSIGIGLLVIILIVALSR
ncbi:hypothetical protein FVE85_5603 [Porphyridium purpureum]|uniref:PDZ domain-containing protein n=1 Tax=Porphyridium purpureum TaxID=35688 RepID=A0A5J4Z469_PORPP|nr:hypothetical protein FVE85_5603 [Porphyridium purpureum]|eukprot:POR4726..scf295_1